MKIIYALLTLVIYLDTILTMRRFIVYFFGFVVLYHIVVTYVSFGLGIVPPYVILLFREILWGGVSIAYLLAYRNHIRTYIRNNLEIFLVLLFVLVFSILTSVVLWVDVKGIVVWFKYTLFYFFPFIVGIFIGVVWGINTSEAYFKKRLLYVWRIFVYVLIAGIVRQISKNIIPEIFYAFGYGGLGDYMYWANPPLYYLTWPQWFQRFSGIFSGPNNYWYFLVAMFGLFWYGVRSYIVSPFQKTLLWMLFIGSLLATLSRGAILWVLIQVVLISYTIYKANRRVVWFAIVAWVLAVVGLSLFKWESTVAHVIAKFSSLQYVFAQPMWYGLWSSGPSIHSQWWYLPENFYIQLMMDLGIHGFALWVLFRYLLYKQISSVYNDKPNVRNILYFVSMWFVWLLLEWMFLHVLEDSMVNYVYFILWGIVLWYAETHKRIFKPISSHT